MPKRLGNVIRFESPARKAGRGLAQEICEKEIRTLYQLVEYYGLVEMCRDIGVSRNVLLMVLAGLSHRCHAKSMQAVRDFFASSRD